MKKILNTLILLSTIVICHESAKGQILNIKDFGAKGDGATNDTEAIQKAIDHCSENGGTVYFPKGTFMSGTVFLKSNIVVEVSQQAVWKGIADQAVFPELQSPYPSREDVNPRKSFMYAIDQENITLTGRGTIFPNGGHEVFFKKPQKIRPFGILMIECKNIEVSDLTLTNSAFWMQRYFQCEHLRIKGIRVFNHCNRNNDGIDIDGCKDVIVSDSYIDSSDDALTLKSEGAKICQDVVVTNCVLSSFASSIKLGTASIGGFKRISIDNCIVKPSAAKEMNHPHDAWGGLAGIDLLNVDGGVMEDININNIVMDSIETPIFIRLGNRHDQKWEGQKPATYGICRNIQISNVLVRNGGKISSSISAYPGQYIENVYLNNIQVHLAGGGTEEDATTPVPENSDYYPYNRMFESNLNSYGFFIRHVKNLQMNNIDLMVDGEDARFGIVLDDIIGADLRDVKSSYKNKRPFIEMKNSKGIRIHE